MVKNKAHHQQWNSIHDFLVDFGSEEQCATKIFDFKWPEGFTCPECTSKSYCTLKSRKLYQCNNCHHQTSLTSGTLFEGSKLPLTTWFKAIFYISKDELSTRQLSSLLGISYNTTYRLRHKLMQAMKEHDAYGFITTDNVYRKSSSKVLSDEDIQGKLPVKTPTGTKEKHLNRYLSEYCYKLNRGHEFSLIVQHLIQSSAKTTPIPERILKIEDHPNQSSD